MSFNAGRAGEFLVVDENHPAPRHWRRGTSCVVGMVDLTARVVVTVKVVLIVESGATDRPAFEVVDPSG